MPVMCPHNQVPLAMSRQPYRPERPTSSAPTAPMVTKSSASPQSMLVMMRFTPFSDSGSPWIKHATGHHRPFDSYIGKRDPSPQERTLFKVSPANS